MVGTNIWSELSPENKTILQNTYKKLLNTLKTLDRDSIVYYEYCAKIQEYEKLFGVENINPPIIVNTWEDLCLKYKQKQNLNLEYNINTLYNKVLTFITDDSIRTHIVASYKIALLIIEKYGRLITIDDIEDNQGYIWTIQYCASTNEFDNNCRIMKITESKSLQLLSFKSKKDAETFYNYNKELINQYFLT